jgi:hypothetical protein
MFLSYLPRDFFSISSTLIGFSIPGHILFVKSSNFLKNIEPFAFFYSPLMPSCTKPILPAKELVRRAGR